MSRETLVGVGSAIVAVFIALAANLAGNNLVEVLILLGFVLLVAAIVFGLVVPWAKGATTTQPGNRPAKAGLTLSVLGFIAIVAFWSGLPVILGAGGAALGQVGRERSSVVGRAGLSLGAIIIGVIAAAVGASILVLEWFGI